MENCESSSEEKRPAIQGGRRTDPGRHRAQYYSVDGIPTTEIQLGELRVIIRGKEAGDTRW